MINILQSSCLVTYSTYNLSVCISFINVSTFYFPPNMFMVADISRYRLSSQNSESYGEVFSHRMSMDRRTPCC